MTKEEAKEILSGYVKACKEDDLPTLEMFEYDKVIEAMAMGAKALSIPSLPSNLGEAAENCTYCEHAYARESFKEGAEWMAGHGVSVDASVVPYDDGIGLNMPDEDILSGKFKDGDNVVVQIRKK